MPNPRVTIRDIAAAVGLHFTTVSLALRNSPRLPAETRRKVRQAAKRLGYRCDPMLTALSAYRRAKSTPHYQATIAWINNWPRRDHLLEIPVFKEYYLGAAARAQECGYVIEEFWLQEPGMTPEKLQRVLKARGIRAIIFAPQDESKPCPAIDLREFSAVALGYSIRPSQLHVVTNHHFHTMNLMMRYVHGLGYRRIGLAVSRGWDSKVDNGWFGGLMLWRWTHPELQVVEPLENSLAPKILGAWIKKEKPDVIVSFSEVYDRVVELGHRVPQEVGFASLALHKPGGPISGCYQQDLLIGRKVVDFLIDMLHRDERGLPEVPVRTLVESVWSPGKTLQPQGKAGIPLAPALEPRGVGGVLAVEGLGGRGEF